MSSVRRGSLPTVLSPGPGNLGGGGTGGGGGSSAVGPGRNVVQQSSLSPEYMEAMQIMNEANMSYACELLLSERDFDESTKSADTDTDTTAVVGADQDNDKQSDYTKLLELYSKCQSAMKVITKTVADTASLTVPIPSAPLLVAPASRSGVGGPRLAGLPKLKQKAGGGVAVTAASSKQGVVPLRRGMNMSMTNMNRTTTTTAAPPGSLSLKPLMPMKRPMERETSHSSVATEDSGAGGAGATVNSAKKARLSPTTTSNDVMAPPPSALNFLARLNKDAGSSNNSLASSTAATTATNTPTNTSINSGKERGKKSPANKVTRRGSSA
jgi:hypothetical protein